MDTKIRKFLQDCYTNYLPSIRRELPDFPTDYRYPSRNPTKPVLPVQITQNKLMVIGAFPSARFERKDGLLIPVADNLSPFGEEKYFDGQEIRVQASRESLNKNYFPQLQLTPEYLWLTDIVKIYLFPKKHIKNCISTAPDIQVVNTHEMFLKIAKVSLGWIIKEIQLCNPSLIITLGEIPARVIGSNFVTKNAELLNGEVNQIEFDKVYRIAHLAHPEIRRLNKEWDERTEKALKTLAKQIQVLVK